MLTLPLRAEAAASPAEALMTDETVGCM